MTAIGMERWQNRVAVVTGASSGIGAILSRQLVAAGVIVVALARRLPQLQELLKQLPDEQRSRLRIRQCDVTNVESVESTFHWIETELGGADILINNAGKLVGGQLLTMSLDTMQQILQTNIIGAVSCTQRIFQSLRKRKTPGHVVLMNSIVGHYLFNPLPGSLQEMNIYPATKHALTAITELLRQEFRDLKTHIKVTVSS